MAPAESTAALQRLEGRLVPGGLVTSGLVSPGGSHRHS